MAKWLRCAHARHTLRTRTPIVSFPDPPPFPLAVLKGGLHGDETSTPGNHNLTQYTSVRLAHARPNKF